MTHTHSEQTARGEVAVEQRHRDAAEAYFRLHNLACADWMRDGARHPLSDAFARFERDHLASLSPADNGALGEVLRKAREELQGYCEWLHDVLQGHDPTHYRNLAASDFPRVTELRDEIDAALSTTLDRGEDAFDAWWEEMEGFHMRGERAHEELNAFGTGFRLIDWMRAAFAAGRSTLHPSPEAPIEGQDVEKALQNALELACLSLAFIGRDQGTERIDKTLDGLCKLAAETEKQVRSALAALRAPIERKGESLIEQIELLVDAVQTTIDHGAKGVHGTPEGILASAIGSAQIALDAWRAHYPVTATAIRNAAGEKG